MNINLFILFIHIIVTQVCYSAKILAVIPFAAKSHHNFIRPILKELASRGHEITFYTSIPLQQNVTNINEIVIADPMKNSPLGKISFKMIQQIGSVPYLSPPALCFFGPVLMEEILNDKDLQKLIQSNDKYDLILAETHFFQEPLIGFGHKFQAPVVSLHTFSTYFYTNEFIGNPIGVSYLPSFELPYSDKMTFFQRVHNAIRTWINFIAAYTYYLPTQEKLMRKYFTYRGAEKMPSLVEMLQNVSLVVTNTQVSIDFPHPEVPTVINTAGLHISPKRQPLPQDLKKFMDDSKDGVIYFSFGSVVPSEELPDEMKTAFIKAFEKIKQNILWKLPVEPFPGLPKNVKLGSWFPQQDILAHPNCIAFITHGGLLSQIESVYFGVPLIGVPFFGEQSLNMNRAVQRGFAIYLNQYNITEESVSWAINEILTKPSYRENVKKYSNIFRDNQNPPLEKAVYWIEYVIRHKGAPHLRTEGRALPYYKYLLLDVILFLSVSLLIILYIFYKIIFLILSLVFGNKSKPKLKSNKKDN